MNRLAKFLIKTSRHADSLLLLGFGLVILGTLGLAAGYGLGMVPFWIVMMPILVALVTLAGLLGLGMVLKGLRDLEVIREPDKHE